MDGNVESFNVKASGTNTHHSISGGNVVKLRDVQIVCVSACLIKRTKPSEMDAIKKAGSKVNFHSSDF